jgi:hypothetical protein
MTCLKDTHPGRRLAAAEHVAKAKFIHLVVCICNSDAEVDEAGLPFPAPAI